MSGVPSGGREVCSNGTKQLFRDVKLPCGLCQTQRPEPCVAHGGFKSYFLLHAYICLS